MENAASMHVSLSTLAPLGYWVLLNIAIRPGLHRFCCQLDFPEDARMAVATTMAAGGLARAAIPIHYGRLSEVSFNVCSTK